MEPLDEAVDHVPGGAARLLEVLER